MPRRQPSTIKDAAKLALEERYGLKDRNIINSFPNEISWEPEILWESTTHYIALETSTIGPFRETLRIAFGDLTNKELPCKIYIAYPRNANQPKEAYQKDIKNAKNYGIGIISIDDNNNFVSDIEKDPISIPLVINEIDYSLFRKPICPTLRECYATYMNGNPQMGLQRIAQLIESKIRKLGDQAITKGNLTTGGYTKGNQTYALGNLIDDLMRQRIVSNAVLGRCRGFVDDRNGVSHEPTTIDEAIKIEKNTKENYKLALRILEELPAAFASKNYKF
jgi:hypothetical protein